MTAAAGALPALVHQPRIIFADELTGNLDSQTTYEIMCSLQATVREQGQTLLLVTHDRDVAPLLTESFSW